MVSTLVGGARVAAVLLAKGVSRSWTGAAQIGTFCVQRRGFRVTTNTTFFNTDTPQTVREVLDFLNDDLRVGQMMISPAYAYWKAPDQEHFLGAGQTRELFRQAFAGGRRKRWRLNHSPLFLDFLEGKTDFACTAWGIRATRCSAGSGPAT